jgi:hypothetical protein
VRIAFWMISSILAIASVPGLQISTAQAVGLASPSSAASPGGCRGLPFSAKETITSPTHTADGTPVEHKEVRLVWRDAEGRTRHETVGKTRSGAEYHYVMVYDPVQRATWTWFSGNEAAKVVHVRPLRDSEAPESCPVPPAPQSPKADAAAHDPGSNSTIEMLPPSTINGVQVLGDRKTILIPAGTHGNANEIKVTQEFWISPDFAVMVRRTIDDPRTGKLVAELSDVKRSVPDPALFKVPSGYQMRVDPPPAPSVLDEIMRDIHPVIPPPPPK